MAGMLTAVGWVNMIVGMIFEPMFTAHIEQVKFLRVPSTGGAQRYAFSRPPMMYVDAPTSIQNNTLYIPAACNNDTFDFFFVGQPQSSSTASLVFLQLTVGSSHTGGRWNGAVLKIVQAVRGSVGFTNVKLVYVIPRKNLDKFTTPGIAGLPKKQKLEILKMAAPFDFDAFAQE
jgi:hypothetical protein